MSNDILLIQPDERPQVERITDESESQINAGDWYWFKHKGDASEWDGFDEVLCCVIGIGSNYAEIEYPCVDGYHWKQRVHFREWDERCRYESNPQSYFDQWANEEKREIKRINAEIRDICARLGVQPGDKRIESKQSGGSLSVVSSAVDTSEYKTALIVAKEKTLPALFKEIKEHSAELTRWMTASSMSLKAQCGDMQEAIEVINDRIFTVSIYAGLVENIDLVRDGEPAGMGEKLRIMQGKLFMDEECLLNYSHGGMEFKDITEFDAWLSKEENMERLLPFPRCMVAFQVRRYKKHRDNPDGSLATAWINFELGKLDELTFLYIRNGERLYRLNTEIDFGNELFADRDEFNFGEPMMVNNRSDHSTMPVREYQERVKEYLQERREFKAKRKHWKELHAQYCKWRKANPKVDENESGFDYRVRAAWQCPEWRSGFEPREWKPLDDSNVYVDDVNDRIRKQANHYNRISTLIQGLLDRSETLHPHPPVKLWTPRGFESFIELIYDHDRTLYDGPEPPSWEEYKAACNASIGVGSVVTGQYDFWRNSLPREVRRNSGGWSGGTYVPYRYTDGNPGPGNVVQEWSQKKRQATFRWIQTRYIYRRGWREESGDREFKRSISVPVDELFNISGYKPGDYKQFFNDPRTRRDYLKWAHLLLTAEEYYAGNLDPETFEKKKKPTVEVAEETEIEESCSTD